MLIESLPTGIAIPSAGTELLAHGADRVVERGVLAGVPRRGHPIRGQLHLGERGDRSREQVRHGFRHGHERRRRGVDQRDRRALAERHRLAGVAFVVVEQDRGVRHRNLPGPTIWSRATSPDTVRSPMVMRKSFAATLGKESTRRAASATSTAAASNSRQLPLQALTLAGHLRRLAEEQRHRHRNGRVAEVGCRSGRALAPPSRRQSRPRGSARARRSP